MLENIAFESKKTLRLAAWREEEKSNHPEAKREGLEKLK